MKILGCRFEKAVWRAVASGSWPEGLREHAEVCPACSEVALVSGGLLELSRGDAAASGFPDPQRILWRAEWLAARRVGERATRPILLYQRFAAAVSALGLAGLAFWAGPYILRQLPVWEPHLPNFGLTFLTPAVYAAAALTCAAILLLFRAVLAED